MSNKIERNRQGAVPFRSHKKAIQMLNFPVIRHQQIKMQFSYMRSKHPNILGTWNVGVFESQIQELHCYSPTPLIWALLILIQRILKGYSIWDPEGGPMENFTDTPSHIFIFFATPHIFYIFAEPPPPIYFYFSMPRHIFFSIPPPSGSQME